MPLWGSIYSKKLPLPHLPHLPYLPHLAHLPLPPLPPLLPLLVLTNNYQFTANAYSRLS